MTDRRWKRIIKEKTAINNQNWPVYAGIFQLVDKLAGVSRYPVIGAVLKRVLRFDRPEKHFTQGYVINLDQSLNDRGRYQKGVLPIALVEKAIRESSYRSIMHKCICRDGGKPCRNYPVDFGCIFIGEGSRVTEKRKIARSATVEESLAHVRKAAEYGLVCQCIWVEAEEFVWGVDSADLHRFLEICFCCPCCCVALKNYHRVGQDIQDRFRSVGWRARAVHACSACGICETECPKQAIRIEGDRALVAESCIGCGICVSRCPEGALEIVPVSSMRPSIQDYFRGFTPDV